MKKIGILTSGGDCQGLNAAIRAVAKSIYYEENKAEIYGIADGYYGLINGLYKKMEPEDFSGILTLGGTILGTSRQSYKTIVNDEEKTKAMKETYRKAGLDCLVVMGGNGTHKTAALLAEEGLNVITLPKTIDNDIWGTDMTFGFNSACGIATNVIDCIHTTASSHGRVFMVEIMGHKAGWLALYAGIAGGADVILIPEIPYNAESVAAVIERRKKDGKGFSIIAVAEGALSQDEAGMKKKEFKAHRAALSYPSVSYKIAHELEKQSSAEIRIAVPGHFQRGGSPSPADRVLCTRFGAAAAKLIKEEKYGFMTALHNNAVVPFPLAQVAGKLKRVSPDCEIITSAREIGISFGD